MKKMLLALATLLMTSKVTLAAELSVLSFHGKASIEQIKSGSMKSTIRLGDRTAAPTSFKVGQIVPLVNADQAEDNRKFEEQIAANAYGKVELLSIRVSQFDVLSANDKKEFLQYYTPEKIKEAKGIVTILGLQLKK